MHTQRDFCRYVHRRGAYYLLPAADNQPRLLAALDALAWDNAPLADITHTRAHGRDEVRTLQLLPLTQNLSLHARQAYLVERYIRDPTTLKTTAAAAELGITNLPTHRATPAHIAVAKRGHWGIENREHYIRDVTLGEDACQVRTKNGPRALATLRNLTISLLRLAGYHDNIPDGLRDNQMNPALPLHHLGIPMQPT
jgi:hypothetical protein